MGYCTITDFAATLAQTLTTGSPNPATLNKPAKLSDLGKQLNLTSPTGSSVGTYSLDDVNYYIRQAQSIIDAALSEQYVTPLRIKAKMEMRLLSDVSEYSDLLKLTKYEVLMPGDQLVIVQGGVEEQVEVEEIIGGLIDTVQPVANSFTEGARVLLIKYPNPVPYIAAKLACAMFYDKYARAQSEPMKTEFGDTLRKEANAELNNIREGRTILEDIDRQGSRFVNSQLYSRYGLDALINSDGTRSDSSRG